MSLAIAAAANPAPARTPETGRETVDRGAGAKFADLLSSLEKEAAQLDGSTDPKPSAPSTPAAAATSATATKPVPAAPLDAGLAGLVRDALASGGAASSITTSTSTKASTNTSAEPRAAKSGGNAKLDAGVAAAASNLTTSGPRQSAGADAATPKAKTKADDAKTATVVAINPGAAAATAPIAPIAPGFAVSVPAAFALSVAPSVATAVAAGAPPSTPSPRWSASPGDSRSKTEPAVSLAIGANSELVGSTLSAITGGDLSLFVSTVEQRTYLGLAPASSAPATAATAVANAAATMRADLAGPTPSSSEAGTAVKRAKPSTDAPPERSNGSGSTSASDPGLGVAAKSTSAKSGGSATDANANKDGAAPQAAAATSSTFASAAPTPVGVSATFPTPVTLDQLPGVIADAAEALGDATPNAAAAPASSAQPIKELQINLAPAELGALQVTMRLADGKLSVVLAIDKPSTLKAIAGDRDAIAARLGAASSALDSLIVQPMRAAATSGADTAGEAQSLPRENSANGANRDLSAGGKSPSRRDSAAEAARRQSAAGRRSAGDLTV